MSSVLLMMKCSDVGAYVGGGAYMCLSSTMVVVELFCDDERGSVGIDGHGKRDASRSDHNPSIRLDDAFSG